VQEVLGQEPIVAVTPAPELLYMATRMKTIAVLSQPESLTAQQFTKLAAAMLDLEKQQP
jgi:MinD-like ATPase involved in chromosome partitioning or flagellar assembly